MLSKPLAFEQDKTAIFLRNQIMHLHYSKLSDIKDRKNSYLPSISSNKKYNHNNSSLNIHSPSLQDSKTKEEQYYINHDNVLLFSKLAKIQCRPNQIIDDSEVISGYLNIKKNTRKRVRALKKKLLNEENDLIMSRIRETKPVINNDTMTKDFYSSQKICGTLRKIHPSNSTIGIYLTKGESDLIRLYDKTRLANQKKNKEKGIYKSQSCAKIDNDNNKEGSGGKIKKMKVNIDKENNNGCKASSTIKSNNNIWSDSRYSKGPIYSVPDYNKSNKNNTIIKNGEVVSIDRRILAKVRYVGYNTNNKGNCNKYSNTTNDLTAPASSRKMNN